MIDGLPTHTISDPPTTMINSVLKVMTSLQTSSTARLRTASPQASDSQMARLPVHSASRNRNICLDRFVLSANPTANPSGSTLEPRRLASFHSISRYLLDTQVGPVLL